jgi:hypothetical protein
VQELHLPIDEGKELYKEPPEAIFFKKARKDGY